MAKVYLDATDTAFTVSNSNVEVFGVTGAEAITVNAGSANVNLDQNVDKVVFAGAVSDYVFLQTAAVLNVYAAVGGVATGPVMAIVAVQPDTDGTKLTFSNGSTFAKLTGTVMTLGGTTVDSGTATTVVPGTIDATETSTGSVAAQTFTLTTGVDTFVGGAGNDIFNAGTAGTFNALDSLTGGAGTDTLTVADNTNAVATTNRTVTGIETASLSSASTVTANTTAWTDLTKLTAVGAGGVNVTAASTTAITASNTGANAMAIIGGGGVSTFATGAAAVTVGQTAVKNAFTSIAVTGGTTVAIADNLGNAVATTAATSGSNLTTVSVDGNTGNVDITAKGLTAITAANLVTNGQTVTNTDLDTAHALSLTLDGVDSSADAAATGGETINFVDAEATSVALSATGAASYDVTVTAAKATAVTIAADEILQIDTLTAGVATTLDISGDSAVTITAHSLAAAAAITSTSSAAVTITGAILAGQSYAGGAGVDTITLTATGTKAITTGAGNDVITYAGPMGSGGSVNAGDDTDTIKMTGAQAETATGSTTFAGTVSNFEVLELTAATGAARAINMANADGINSLTIQGATVGALTITNAAANFTLTQKALTSFASSIALASDVGTSDNVNLVFSATDGFTNSAAFTVANVETLTITTDDTDTTATTAVFVTPITAAAVKTVTVAGDAGISFIGGLTGTAITSLDASGLTGTGAVEGLTWTTGALAASSNIKGSAAGTNTVIFSAANTASTFVTYTGGTGADNITGSNGLNNVVNLGNGANSYTQVGAGNSTITGGTGVDTITLGTGANTVVAGAGNDVITVAGVSVGLNTIDVGTGTDTVAITAIPSAAGYYTSITGMAAGDIVDVSAVIGTSAAVSTQTVMGAAITLGGASSFANYLDAAAAGDGNAANTIIKWFQYGGNTYIVEDTSAAATFQDGADTVVELAGLVTLTTSTIASGVITLV